MRIYPRLQQGTEIGRVETLNGLACFDHTPIRHSTLLWLCGLSSLNLSFLSFPDLSSSIVVAPVACESSRLSHLAKVPNAA